MGTGRVDIWVFAVLFAFGLTALVRHNGILGGAGSGLRGSRAGRFERFWSRRDGRLVAIAWLALFAVAWLAPLAVGIGDDTSNPLRAQQTHPNRYVILLAAQSVAAVLLVPITAGLYLYRRAIPQIARSEADERERVIQGDVYRRTYTIIIAAMALWGTLLALSPDVGRSVLAMADSYGNRWVGLALPAWVLLFMLPSLAYAWMFPRGDDAAEAEPSQSRLEL